MKLKKIGAILTVILLGMTALPAAAAEPTAGNELPQKIMDIVNGSDVTYGVGVPIIHGENGEIEPYFASGGKDHTHQYIVASALTILNNDKGSSLFNSYAGTLAEYTDWPDVLGNETDAGTFAGHFYDPDTNKNWLGQTNPTAKTRAEMYYNNAVSAYEAGYVDKAFAHLGKGSHYVSDLNEPHHASNLTAVNSNHSVFEKYVDDNRTSYVIAGNTLNSEAYQEALNSSVADMMYKAAKSAKSLAPQAQQESTYSVAARNSVQGATTSVTKYFYKFGKQVGIY